MLWQHTGGSAGKYLVRSRRGVQFRYVGRFVYGALDARPGKRSHRQSRDVEQHCPVWLPGPGVPGRGSIEQHAFSEVSIWGQLDADGGIVTGGCFLGHRDGAGGLPGKNGFYEKRESPERDGFPGEKGFAGRQTQPGAAGHPAGSGDIGLYHFRRGNLLAAPAPDIGWGGGRLGCCWACFPAEA